MNLNDWRLERGLTHAKLAEKLSTPDDTIQAETVRRWCLPLSDPQARTPRPLAMRRIAEVTKGRVTANDFMRRG